MKRLLKKVPHYLFELFIVFIGVYAAFTLNNWREEQAALKTRIKYFEGFVAELQGIQAQASRVSASLEVILKELDQKTAEGARPPLRPLPDLGFTVQAFITKSAFSETHFEAIDVPFLVNISNGANLFDIIEKRIALFHESSRRQLYTSNPDFYDREGNLKPEYAWYFEDLRFIHQMLNVLIEAIEKGAIPETKTLIEKLRAN